MYTQWAASEVSKIVNKLKEINVADIMRWGGYVGPQSAWPILNIINSRSWKSYCDNFTVIGIFVKIKKNVLGKMTDLFLILTDLIKYNLTIFRCPTLSTHEMISTYIYKLLW